LAAARIAPLPVSLLAPRSTREFRARSVRLERVRRFVMMVAVTIAFVVLIGPLALLYGVDSRVDDRRGEWPNRRR